MSHIKIIRDTWLIAIIYLLLIITLGFKVFPSLIQEHELHQRILPNSAMFFITIDKIYYLIIGVFLSVIIILKDLLLKNRKSILIINILLFLSILFCLFYFSTFLTYHPTPGTYIIHPK